MATDKKVQGVYQMNRTLRQRMKKFMAFNNLEKFPDAALRLIEDGLKSNKF